MDWNVFFSTISQTSGAIVGIFSAFLITKIISNQSDFSKLKNQATHNIIDSESVEAEAKSRYFDWYNRRAREKAINKMGEDFWENEKFLPLEKYISMYNFSPFDSYEEKVNAVTNKITELSERLEEKRKREEEQRVNPFAYSLGISQMFNDNISTYIISPELRAQESEERELIDQLAIKVERQAKKNVALCEELKSGVDSVNLVTSSIVTVLILFFVGVIYPLSFLPWQQGKDISLSLSAFWDILFSLQGFMLFLISVIFSALMMVFLVINMKLKHSVDVIDKITHYSDISNYSPYLANYKKNKVG